METTTGVWECANQWEWMRRVAKSNLPPLIITAAITGGMQGKEINPNHPESPKEQAQQTYDAYRAGATMVHVHARKPDNLSVASTDPVRYREVNGLIREKCPDIIIQNTTGGGPRMSIDERMASIRANPEVCSLNMGPMTGKGKLRKREAPLTGRPEDIVYNDGLLPMTFAETERYARAILEKGIKPEMEVYHPGQWWLLNNLIDMDLVKPPYLIQFVMGMRSGIYPTPKNLLIMIESAAVRGIFSVCGVGAFQSSMLTMAILLGLDVRTGMEDNVYIERGKLCRDNAELVEKVVRIAKELGREIATPKQARQMLGLSETPSRYD